MGIITSCVYVWVLASGGATSEEWLSSADGQTSEPEPELDLDLAAMDPPEDAVMGDGLGRDPGVGDLMDEPDTQAATCADGTKLDGIDISKWQGDVDWGKIAAAGTDFAFVRVSDGLNTPDQKFAQNWQNARAAGITTGVYQFFRPNQDPIKQADLLLNAMGALEPGDLPPVIDVEATGGLSKAQVTAAIHKWVDHVEAKLGVQPIIYSGRFFWQDNVGSSDFSSYPFWIAHYTNSCPNLPTQWSDWEFHQYTESGSIAGVSGNVDQNYFNGDAEALASLTFGGPAACGDGVCGGAESSDSCFLDCPPCAVIPPDGKNFDNGDACYQLHGPGEYWREDAAKGHGGSLVWTESTKSTVYNFATVDLFVEEAGTYDIHVYVHKGFGTAKAAKYQVTAGGTTQTVTLDQSQGDGWTMLGSFDFAEGGGQLVKLEDKTGTADQKLLFDAIRVVPEGTPTCDDEHRIDDGQTGGGAAEDLERGDEAQGCSVDPAGCGAGSAFGLGALLLLLGSGGRRRRARIAGAIAGLLGVAGLAGCSDAAGGTRDFDDLHEDDREDPADCGDEVDPTDEDDPGAEPPDVEGPAACYLGADAQNTTCLPIAPGDPYNYPSPLNNNYREPIAYLDVTKLDLNIKVAPNFKLGEFCQTHKGQFQVLQPHAVKKIQEVRDAVGSLTVNSGYRSPTYNASVGGATRSRHMYGDAFDVVGTVSQQSLMNTCTSKGAGYVAKYASGHVHCDWRNTPVDALFYGSLAKGTEAPEFYAVEDLQAQIVELGEGWLGVEATGYDTDEGLLLNEWQALDADENVLAESDELEFLPPEGTAVVRVIVGGLAEVDYEMGG
jgi:GH25 family lysozyme M1 (1,4-beta-N-acetylmuramidase)